MGFSFGFAIPTSLIDNIEDIETETNKIALADSGGLDAFENSHTYLTGEVERHLHSHERWFETASVPNGQIHVADRIGLGAGAFQLDAGNDDWGAWVQILGTSDTPALAGTVRYHPHRILVSNAERNEVYFIQMAFGASGAAALAADSYTEAVFRPLSNQIDSGPIMIQNRRQAVGTITWMRTMCPGQNTATLSFFLGVHSYEG